MKSYQEIYEFLKDHILHSRFEGRNDECQKYCGENYSDVVTKSAIEGLEKIGTAWIDHFSSNSGRAIHYDCELNILNPDSPKIEINYKGSSLTNIFGVSF